MYYRLFLFAVLALAIGCKNKGCDLPSEIAKVPVEVEIERLERPFYQVQTKADMLRFIEQNPLFAQKFLQRDLYPSDSDLVNALQGLATNEELKKLAGEVEQKFGDMNTEQQQLVTAFKVMKYHYPEFQEPQVKTFVSGFNQDFFISDSLLVLGLDFFAGKDASYRPDTYEYILKRYEREYMVPAAILLMSNRFNRAEPTNRNLLSEMVTAGKAYYFVQTVMPCTPDSLIIGYTSREIADMQYNEGKVWAHFIEKSLLYDRNPFTLNKYIGERPNTPEIDARAPGRIGTWVGWQIVRAYMERHPEVTLPQLMAQTDFQKIFNDSKYKPERR